MTVLADEEQDQRFIGRASDTVSAVAIDIRPNSATTTVTGARSAKVKFSAITAHAASQAAWKVTAAGVR